MKKDDFEYIPYQEMRCIGEHECQFENRKLVLPEKFQVPDGPIWFVVCKDEGESYLHFFYDEYKAKRRYHPQKNRDMLALLQEHTPSPFFDLLLVWAKRQPPIKVPRKVRNVIEYTSRAKRSGMDFFGVGGAILGANEPYMVPFRSAFTKIDVFGNRRQR